MISVYLIMGIIIHNPKPSLIKSVAISYQAKQGGQAPPNPSAPSSTAQGRFQTMRNKAITAAPPAAS